MQNRDLEKTSYSSNKTFAAILWNFSRVFTQTGVSFIVGIILARLLSPESFGIMAIALFFVGFSELLSSVGVGAAIIQRKNLTQRHLEAALMFSTLMAVLFFTLWWISSDYIAVFFDEPALVDIIKVLSIGMFVSTATSVHRAHVIREMNFKLLAKLDVFGFMIGYALISLTLVYLDYDVWGLVIGNLVWMCLTGLLLFYFSEVKCKPRWRSKETKELLAFGLGISLNSFIAFFVASTNTLVIGKFLGAGPLGLFSRANQISGMPLKKIAVTISSVLFSSYSSIQDQPELLKNEYHRALTAVAMISLPILVVAVISGEYVIVGLLGDKWVAAAPIFQLLCFGAMFSNILHIAGSLVQATGHVYLEAKRQMISLIILVAGSLYAIQYGLHAVIWVQISASICLYFTMGHLVIWILDSNWKEYFSAQAPGVLLAILVGAWNVMTIYCLDTYFDFPVALDLLIISISAGFSYVFWISTVPVKAFKRMREKGLKMLASKMPQGPGVS
ncbi:MAG: PST family polysaccharide transporter [Paracoccaceae bacterium]|jgi:PST family polysaccharide transporter